MNLLNGKKVSEPQLYLKQVKNQQVARVKLKKVREKLKRKSRQTRHRKTKLLKSWEANLDNKLKIMILKNQHLPALCSPRPSYGLKIIESLKKKRQRKRPRPSYILKKTEKSKIKKQRKRKRNQKKNLPKTSYVCV